MSKKNKKTPDGGREQGFITAEQALNKLEQLHKEIRRLPLLPNSFIFTDLYKSILALYTLKEYTLVFSLSNIIILGLKSSISYSFAGQPKSHANSEDI